MPSFWELLLVLLIVVLLFGAGKISKIMEDVGKGIKAFKKGMDEEDGKQVKEVKATKKKPAKNPAKKSGKKTAAKNAKSKPKSKNKKPSTKKSNTKK
jgi:sec-independent protein translocase protein TatA